MGFLINQQMPQFNKLITSIIISRMDLYNTIITLLISKKLFKNFLTTDISLCVGDIKASSCGIYLIYHGIYHGKP